MMTDISSIKNRLDTLVAEKELIKRQRQSLIKEEKIQAMLLIRKKKALEVVKDAAFKTQDQLRIHLSEMTTSGLNSVFDEPYDFQVLFELKRDKAECGLFFQKDGNLINPIKYSGIGACDVAAFCLRCAAWSMDKRKRNVLILDEPFKHLSRDHHERAGKLVQFLSEKLNLQIIMVTHSEKMTEYADRIFKVSMKKNISKVEVIK